MPATRGRPTLPVEQWPPSDRAGWIAACRPAVRLSRGGAASGMSLNVQHSHARAYGYLLAWCRGKGDLDDRAPAAGVVTPATIAAFLADLSVRVGSVTQWSYMQRILRVASILAPEQDFSWLNDLVLELKDRARPRPKAHRIVTGDRLLGLGLSLIERGERSDTLKQLCRARLVRDGLMIAILSVCPIRLGNLASLRLGRQVRRIDGTWWIVLPAAETKSRRPDERPLPSFLTAPIDRWVDTWRPLFLNAGDAFWPSTKGGALAYTFVGNIITETTRRELGVAISPHLFRDCAVYTIATRAGDRMSVASALLQHSDPRVTQDHYNKGAMISAAVEFQEILERTARGKR